MGYTMKRGNSAVPFKELGSSPAKDKGHGGKKGHNHDDELDEQSKEAAIKRDDLPNLSGTTDNDENMPVKRSGLGPRTNFGGVKNPELDPSRESEDTAE